MSVFEAWHLPDLLAEDHDGWSTLELPAGTTLRWPRLRPAGLRRMLAALVERRAEVLANIRVDRVIDAVDTVARRLCDPGDPLRRLADDLLPAVSGYSAPMARLVLDRMAADWRRPVLESLLRAEFGGPEALDGFRRDPLARRATRAVGPRLAFHVFAGNVPGVAVTALVRTLLVKSAALGKTAGNDPVLPVLFTRALAETDPRLGGCVAVTYWPGGSLELEAVAAAEADLIVVYGGAEAVAGVRASAGPAARIVEHGPRVSLALIARDALEEDRQAATLSAAASAVAAFDQLGCVSPHVFYVEEGAAGQAASFAEGLAAELEKMQRTLPRGRLSPAEAAGLHQFRAAAEFRALDGADVRVHAGGGIDFTIVYDSDPSFEASCLYRTAWVKPVRSLVQVPPLLEPVRGLLQSVGLAGAAHRAGELGLALGDLGVSRLAPLAELPWPPPQAHHDGASPLGELVRWIDIEDPV